MLIPKGGALPANTVLTNTNGTFDQYGMEYNPIAINEVLAYSFNRKVGGVNKPTPRFFIELVNTLTSPELGTTSTPGLGTAPYTALNNASVLDLAGFQSNITSPQTPWDGGCWDIIFSDDNPQNRPDPILGQLLPGGTYSGIVPLVQGSFAAPTSPTPPTPPAPPTPPTAPTTPPYGPQAGDPVIYPLPQVAPLTGATATLDNYFIGTATGTFTYNPLAPYYFLTIGNQLQPQDNNVSPESNPPATTYTLSTTWDPVDASVSTGPTGNILPSAGGVLPPSLQGVAAALTYPGKVLNGLGPTTGTNATGQFFWVCLRRPANPFAPVTAANPMIVVDSMRFPFIASDGVGSTGSNGDTVSPANGGVNYMFSYQRLQPFRGGHAVPLPGATSLNTLDPRYGYTEQIAKPLSGTNYGRYGTVNISANPIYHTLNRPNDNTMSTGTSVTQTEPWDYFPFNDRDFTSVAELLLVPGCPPGLFTKQFAEFAPSQANVSSVFGTVTPLPSTLTATQVQTAPTVGKTAASPFGTAAPMVPHTFPYLVDKFFYTAVTPSAALANPTFGDQYGDGWFKMFEFFEVPSQMIGAIGPVAQGTDFDWLRQDTKPGLINLNLIIDEEVFFSVFGQQYASFTQRLLNFAQLPLLAFQGASMSFSPTTFNAITASAATLPLVAGSSPLPMVVTATTAYGSPAAAYPMNNVGVVATDPVNGIGNRMKAAFAQFLTLRHGGSGYVFGYGSGYPGQNVTVLTGNPNGPTTPALAMASPIPADRPFHSLSYPDIDYTLMRPAALPPSAYTDPPANAPAVTWPPITTPPPPITTRPTLAGANPPCTRGSPQAASQPSRGPRLKALRRLPARAPRRFCSPRQSRLADCSSRLTLSGARPRPRPLTPRTQLRRATPATRVIRT